MRRLKRFVTSMAVGAVAVPSAVMLAGGGTASADGAVSSNQGGGTLVPLANVLRRCDHSNDTHVRVGGDGQGWTVIGRTGNRVTAQVVLQGGSSDTQYMVRFIEMPRSANATCGPGSPGTAVAPLFSDAGGNGTITLEQGVMPGATGAWVLIEGPHTYRTPFGEYYSSDYVTAI
jgi:hypothetical protein